MQLSDTVRDAQNDSIETTIGASAILKIYDLTAGAPANCAAAITGTVLATVTLPADWANASSGGVKTFLGTWEDASADNAGVADFFRVYNSGETVCHMQGTVGQGSGDMSLDNTTMEAGQPFTINTFTLTAGNA